MNKFNFLYFLMVNFILIGCGIKPQNRQFSYQQGLVDESLATSLNIETQGTIQIKNNVYPYVKIDNKADFAKVKTCAKGKKCKEFKTKKSEIVIPNAAKNKVRTRVAACNESQNGQVECSKFRLVETEAVEHKKFDTGVDRSLERLIKQEQEIYDFKLDLLKILSMYQLKISNCSMASSNQVILNPEDIAKLTLLTEPELGEFVSEFDRQVSPQVREDDDDKDIRKSSIGPSMIAQHFFSGLFGLSVGINAFVNTTKIKPKNKIVRSTATIMIISAVTTSALTVMNSLSLFEAEDCGANEWLVGAIAQMNKRWSNISSRYESELYKLAKNPISVDQDLQ